MSESTNNERDAVLAAAASSTDASSPSVGIDYTSIINIDSIVDDTGKYVGTVANGGLTDDLQPTLNGYLPHGNGIEIRVYVNNSVIGYTTVGADGNWSFTPSTPLEAGKTYNFQVFMLNPGDGNTLLPSTTYTIITTEANQDGNTAPDAPVITAGYDDVGDSQGSFSSGTTTDDTTPQLSGKAEAGSLVKIYDGSALIGSVTAGGNGEWTFTPTARSEGQHIFTATATDAAGNVSDRSGDFVVNIDIPDATPARIEHVTDDQGIQQGDIENGGITDDRQPHLTGSAAAGSTVTIHQYDPFTDKEYTLGSAVASANGQWEYQLSGGQVLQYGGESRFWITTLDNTGNTATSPDFKVTLVGANQDVPADTTPPDAPVITSAYDNVGTVQGDLTSGAITDDGTPELHGKAEANSVVKIYDGSALIGSVTAGSDGLWHFTPTARSEGQHIFTATATDAAGNVSDKSGSFVLTVDYPDTTPARIEHVIDDQGIQQGDIENGGITDDRQPHLTGSAAAGSTVTIHQYDPFTDKEYTLGSAVASANGQWEYQLSGGQVLQYGGESRFWITTLDNTGNTATSPDFKVTLVGANQDVPADTTPPDAPTITAGYDNVGPSQGSFGSGTTTDDTTPQLSGKAEAGSLVKIYDGSALIGSAVTNASGSWSFTTPVRSDGQHTFTATATDAAGNVSGKSDGFVVNIDSIILPGPVIAQVGFVVEDIFEPIHHRHNLAKNASTADRTLTLTGTAYGTETMSNIFSGHVQGVELTVNIYDAANNNALLGTVTTTDYGTWSFDTNTLSYGKHDFYVTVTDPSGVVTPQSNHFIVNVESATSMHSLAIQDELLVATNGAEHDNILTLSQIENSHNSTGNVDITDHQQNTLQLTLNDILSEAHDNLFVQDGHKQLAVTGDEGDVVELKVEDLAHNTWQDAGQVTAGGVQYEVYHHTGSDVELLVQHGVELHQVS